MLSQESVHVEMGAECWLLLDLPFWLSSPRIHHLHPSVVPEYVIYILLCLSPQNILELTVCDKDTFTPDDRLMTVRFDVAKIQPGEKVHLNFELNPEVSGWRKEYS